MGGHTCSPSYSVDWGKPVALCVFEARFSSSVVYEVYAEIESNYILLPTQNSGMAYIKRYNLIIKKACQEFHCFSVWRETDIKKFEDF